MILEGEQKVQLVDLNRRVSDLSWRDAHNLHEQLGDQGLSHIWNLFDKSLSAELTSEDVWLDRMRWVIERGDREGGELMGSYSNPLCNQMTLVDVELRPAVMKRINRGHPGQETMLNVSNYLWWPHMRKDLVNLEEECRSSTGYDEEHLERLALMVSQLKPGLDQSRENMKIVEKGTNTVAQARCSNSKPGHQKKRKDKGPQKPSGCKRTLERREKELNSQRHQKSSGL